MSNSAPWLIIPFLALAAELPADDNNDLAHLLDPAADRVPLHTVFPVYPKRALRDRVQGNVEVCFFVDREGRTSRIAVRSSSNRVFEKPAIQAVKASSYEPLQDDDAMSGIKTCRTFRFRLEPVAIEDPVELSDDAEP